ncbi:hypothetical protein GW916_08975 [bacterium]|nr:hypothetical protein [bacterium]
MSKKTLCVSTVLAIFLLQPFMLRLSQSLQSICESRFNNEIYGAWKAALICGTSLGSAHLSQELKSLGLIHLIVVSGAHLVFLENALNLLLKPLPKRITRWSLPPILFLYSLFAGLQPPLVRALFSRLPISPLFLRFLVSGVLSVLFFKELSLSLTLSWAASLLMSWPSTEKPHPASSAAFIFCGLFPLLLPMGAPSLWVALLQPFYSLFFGALVFPISFLNLLLPLDGLTNLSWGFFFNLISAAEQFDFQTHHQKLIHVPSALYLLALQLMYWRAEVQTRRAKCWN